MEKEELFSRLNIKNYNNELEKILENKSFSEGTKNLLLSMLYKVETAYSDYNEVKINTSSKNDTIEQILKIIKEDCNQIEIVKPQMNKKTILEDRKYIVEKQDKKIYVYPNEHMLLYSLYVINKEKYTLNREYSIIKNSIENMLNIGYQMSKAEIIRDFDGWNWSILKEEIQNKTYNLIFQNICILLGNEFIDEELKSKLDFIKMFETKIIAKYGQELGKELYTLVYKNSLLENLKNNKKEQERMLKQKEIMQEELANMENKKQYISNLAESKKVIGRKIRQIDELLNNNQMLKNEFISKNKNLDEENKIFSISNLVENLQEERKMLMLELDLYSNLMKPETYVKSKCELREKIELLEDLNLCNYKEKDIFKFEIKLQKTFLKVLKRDIEKAEIKRDIINLIFEIRYYKLLPISNIQIKDIPELMQDISTIEKLLITKACNLKIMTIISNDTMQNYEVFSKILESKIINLEKIKIEFKNKKEKIQLTIYDDNTLESKLEFENIKDLNVKFNKKIKIFI